jgi:hypothetical protein
MQVANMPHLRCGQSQVKLEHGHVGQELAHGGRPGDLPNKRAHHMGRRLGRPKAKKPSSNHTHAHQPASTRENVERPRCDFFSSSSSSSAPP